MDLEEIKDEYRARVEPRGKSISEILEEAAKETKAYKDLEQENKKLKERVSELEDELWVWKHSYKKLMKDKRLYEKARAVMFGPDEEDLYEDIK